MRWAFLIFFLAACSLAAQQPPTPQSITPDSERFLLWVQRFDQNVTDCILVTPDGYYRREHWVEFIDATKAIVTENERYQKYVFEGQLTPTEVESIRAIVNQADFRALRTPAQQHQSPDFLEILVFRPAKPKQQALLSLATDYKPNKLALKPLFDWMKNMERKKHDVSRSAADKCKIRQEMLPEQ